MATFAVKPAKPMKSHNSNHESAKHTLSTHKRLMRIEAEIVCNELTAADIAQRFTTESYLDATIAMLALDGCAEIVVNTVSHRLHRGDIVLLSMSHAFRFTEVSPDMRCAFLAVSEQFMSSTDATDMIYRRIKYGVRFYSAPVQHLSEEIITTLERRMTEISRSIANRSHTYYKEMILNSLNAFYLDLSDAFDRHDTLAAKLSARHGALVRSFVELLSKHYLTEHKVSFYASRLHLSDHHLTLIIKRVTGSSASDLIYGMLYSHSRRLLSASRLSIQQIASQLNFSDQSSFGKFFRRRSGLTPLDYRLLCSGGNDTTPQKTTRPSDKSEGARKTA